MYKFLILAAVAACAQAGLISSYASPYAYGGIAAPAIGASSQSVSRSWDGSSAISQYSKAVDTAFSSVRKTDTRITNDARLLAPAYAAAPVAYAARAAPLAYATPAAYAAPAYAPAAYAAPAYAAHAPVVAARAGLLGVAYSAAPAVAHVTYDSPLAHYVL